MTTIIRSLGQFSKAIESKIITSLELVANDAKKEIDKYLQNYYEEYGHAFEN